MEVELDAFSGRPNPVWALNAAQARELQALLDGATEAVAAPFEGLGYRGFALRPVNAPGAAGQTAQRVFAGTVQRGAAFYADTRDAEAWLIRLASAQGFGAVFAHLPPR